MSPIGPGNAETQAKVRLFVDSAPEGFAWISGQPEVQTGYGHTLLGRLELHLDPGQCLPTRTGTLSQKVVFSRLREHAHRQGGNAVLYIQTHALNEAVSDCERLKNANIDLTHQNGSKTPRPPWAIGYVARLEPPRPEAHAIADGRLSDPGFDRDATAGLATGRPDAGLGDPSTVQPSVEPSLENTEPPSPPRSAIGTPTPSFVPTAPFALPPLPPRE